MAPNQSGSAPLPVKIAWPDAEDGVGYVHQSMGRMTQRATREERIATALAPPPPSAAPMASSAMATPSGESTQATAATQIRMTYVPTPTHVFGLGARTGGTHEFGVTTRLWSRQRFGVQVEATRASETSEEAPGRVTSLEFAPGVIYMLRDHVTDSVWVRPYVGADVPIRRATFRLVSDDPTPVTDNSIGLRAFGGAELTFPGVPRLAVSADVGYLKADAPFPGFDAAYAAAGDMTESLSIGGMPAPATDGGLWVTVN